MEQHITCRDFTEFLNFRGKTQVSRVYGNSLTLPMTNQTILVDHQTTTSMVPRQTLKVIHLGIPGATSLI